MEFDYTPYETKIVTPEKINNLLTIISSPKNSTTWGLITSAIQIALIAACMFILWRLQQIDRRKHKQNYEKKVIIDKKDEIASDNLD